MKEPDLERLERTRAMGRTETSLCAWTAVQPRAHQLTPRRVEALSPVTRVNAVGYRPPITPSPALDTMYPAGLKPGSRTSAWL